MNNAGKFNLQRRNQNSKGAEIFRFKVIPYRTTILSYDLTALGFSFTTILRGGIEIFS